MDLLSFVEDSGFVLLKNLNVSIQTKNLSSVVRSRRGSPQRSWTSVDLWVSLTDCVWKLLLKLPLMFYQRFSGSTKKKMKKKEKKDPAMFASAEEVRT